MIVRSLTNLFVSTIIVLTLLPVANAQEVSNPIGSHGPVNSINSWNGNLILTSAQKLFGVPVNGLDTLSIASGRIVGPSAVLNGDITCALQTEDGEAYVAGTSLVINGISTSSQLVRVKRSGEMDTSSVFQVEHQDRAYKPWYWRKGSIYSMVLHGDTLFVAGKFTRINNKVHYGIAAFDAQTLQLLDWKLDISYSTQTNIKQLGERMFIYGYFTHFKGGYHPYMIVMDLNSKQILESASPQSVVDNMAEDDTSVFLSGYVDKIGTANSKAVLSASWELENLIDLPNMDHPNYGGEVTALVRDNQKGTFVGGIFNEVLDTSRAAFYYLDSLNRIQDVPLNYSLGEVYHLDFFNDTLLIVAYSSDTNQRVHYFDTRNWKQIDCPLVVAMGNDAQYSSFDRYGADQFILSNVLGVNGKAMYGNVLFHRGTGEWQWLPAARSFNYVGDTLYYLNLQSLNETAYESGPIAWLKPNDTIPQMIARQQGSIQAIAPDGKGGYYLGGDIPGIYEKIVHILPDGREDPDFDFRMWQSSTIRDMVLVGDTLFVAGNFSSQWTIPTGSLILIDVAQNKLIRNAIAVKDEISDLYLKGDTLFLAGAFTSINNNSNYAKLAAIRTSDLSVISWEPKVYGSVASVDTYEGKFYATGTFDSCSGFRHPHLMRFDVHTLKIDTSFHLQFVRNSPSQVPTYFKVKAHNGKLYFGGRTNWAKVNGQQNTGILRVDLASTAVEDLDLKVSHYDYFYDFSFSGDTMFIGGSFLQIRGKSSPYVAAMLLGTGDLIKRFPVPNGAVRTFFQEQNKLWFMGDFMKLDKHDGDYFKYEISGRRFLPVPNNGLDGSRLTILGDHVYVADRSRLLNGFQHKALYKFDRRNDALLKWVPKLIKDHPNASIEQLTVFRDTLCASGSGFNAALLDLPASYRSIVLAVDGDSGTIHHARIFDGGVNGLRNRDHQLLITGTFRFSNYFGTTIAKLDNTSLQADRRFSTSLRVSSLFAKDRHLWATNGNLMRFDKTTGKDTQVLSILRSGEAIGIMHSADSELYLTGTYNGLRHWKYAPYSYQTLNVSGPIRYSIKGDSIGESKLDFSFNPAFKQNGSDLIPQLPGYGGIGLLTEPVRSSNILKFDPSSHHLESIELGQMNSTWAFSRVRGDKLYVANSRLIVDNKTKYGIQQYDLVKNESEGELIGTTECNEFVFYEDLLLQAGDFTKGLIVYDLKSGSVLSNTPTFNGPVNALYIKDSIAFVGGEFDRVNNINYNGLVMMNLNTFQIIPFRVPFPSYCQVQYLLGKGRYLIIAGQNVEPGSSNWLPVTVFDTEFESLYPNRPVCDFDKVTGMSMVQNRLILNVQDYTGENPETRVYNFVTGLQVPEFHSLGLKKATATRIGSHLWVYGSDPNVTARSKNYIARVEGGLYDLSMKVDDHSPKQMVSDKPARMRIMGFGFSESTRFHMENATQTYFPIDSTIAVDGNGFLMSGLFSNSNAHKGSYDLLVYEPGGDTIRIPMGVQIDTAEHGTLRIEINGRDTIRSGRWSTYTLQLINTSNYDLQNVPLMLTATNSAGIKIRERVEAGDSLVFDSEYLDFETDQLLGRTVSANSGAVIIPEVPAEGSLKFSVAVKSASPVQAMELSAWCHGPLTGVQESDALRDAWYTLSDIPKVCLDTAIDRLRSRSQQAWDYRSGRKQAIVDLRSWLNLVDSDCGAGKIDAAQIANDLIPNIDNRLKNYSSSDFNLTTLRGSKPFVDTITAIKKIRVVNSLDPNVKIGYKGYSDLNYTSSLPEELYYSIHFENDSSATAPVQYLEIIDTLDTEALMANSVTFSELSLGDYVIQFAEGSRQVDDVFELSKLSKFLVHVKAGVDQEGILRCEVTALDRLTRDPDELDPFDGFLFPNRGEKNGNGYLTFFVKRIPGKEQISNSAHIVFDNNKALATPVWEINLDYVPPISTVTDLSWNGPTSSIQVNWEGSDVGSGVKDHTLYMSSDNQQYTEVFHSGSELSCDVTISTPGIYYFYTLATDNAGNREMKTAFDRSIDTRTSSVDPLSTSNVRIHPNPSTGRFLISGVSGKAYLRVVDASGRMVMEMEGIGVQVFKLDREGVYFLHLKTENGNVSNFRIIVLR
ncbi:MAG: T9SS type A sorting domain-containing protein [Flavobacteriales bacterium]|nr:T9SS type A sorting domain-containing protein [Flavobacteriales bacterium]